MKNVKLLDLNVYVECSKKLRKLLLEKMKEKGFSIRGLARESNIPHSIIIPFLKGKSIRTENFLKIIKTLQIGEETIKGLNLKIRSGPYNPFEYKFKFPIKLNPLHIRLAAHVLGDSSLERYGCRWYQKSKSGGKLLGNLVYELSRKRIKRGVKDSYGIPVILLDIVCVALNLSRNDLKTSKFVKKLLLLGREYKIEFLAAFIVDEGYISQSSIRIRNTDLELLKQLRKLILSLNYSCSGIKVCRNDVGNEIKIKNRKAKVNYPLKELLLYADGLVNFKEDIERLIKEYGKITGLWHKQKLLEKWSKRVDLNYLYKRRESKSRIIPTIKQLIEKEPVKVLNLSKRFNISYYRIYKILYRMEKRKLIKKISSGTFALPDYNGYVKKREIYK